MTATMPFTIRESLSARTWTIPFSKERMIHRSDVYLSIHSYPVEAIREQVLNGHLDLGYTVLYEMEQLQTEELDYCVINVCPHNVGMLLGNPLAKKKLIEIQDLEKCKFVSILPLYTPSYNGMIDDLCHEAGFEPDMWF